MTQAEMRQDTLPDVLFALAHDRAAAAFAQQAAMLPRGCGEHEAQEAAWQAMQDAGADYSTEAVARCQAASLPDELVDILAHASADQFIRAFLDLAEAWRVGGRA